MKKILLQFLLLFAISAFSQQKENRWQEVLNFENEGKIKSANEVVEKIKIDAFKQKNEAEIIKTFFFQSKYLMKLEENAQLQILANLENQSSYFSVEGKALSNYILANCFQQYLAKNSYKINRPAAEGEDKNDFTFWSETTVESKIEAIYEEILRDKSLHKISLEKYETIFEFDLKSQLTDETIFDYVLRNYIEFLKKKSNNFIEATDQTDVVFYSTENFSSADLSFLTKKENQRIFELYQISEKNGNLFAALNRALFYFGNSSTAIDKKNLQLLDFLDKFQKKTRDNKLLQSILLEKARVYNDRASLDKFPKDKITAVAILDSILAIENRSNTYKAAFVLKNELLQKRFSMQVLKEVYEGENSRAFINFTNIDSVTIRYFSVGKNFDLDKRPAVRDSILRNFIATKKTAYVVSRKLPETADYFQHSTEILLPKLKKGTYLIIADVPGIKLNRQAYSFVTCSSIFASHYSKRNQDVIEVVHRETGKPIAGAKVKLGTKTAKTNKFGQAFFTKAKAKNNRNETANALISFEKDSLKFNFYQQFRTDYSEDQENHKGKVNLYLDRAIYRPGQTVYGKGILFETKNSVSAVVPFTTVFVTIEDPNDEEIKTFEATTNEFGSFVFEFESPKGISGDYSISVEEPDDYEKDPSYNKRKEEHPFWDNADFEYSTISFSVEEYKRPTFEVKFNPSTEIFQLEKEAFVTGNAKAFSGSNVSNAKVTYKVKRQTRVMLRYYDSSEIIAEGETQTDANGDFKINFVASIEKVEDKNDLPTFNYSIEADVTDINGETRKNETQINLGYHAINLSLIVPETIYDDKAILSVNSTNLNGSFTSTDGEISIYYLSEIRNKFKSSFYSKPDKPLISEEELRRLFPYEEFLSDEKTEQLVYSQKFTTTKEQKFKLDSLAQFKNGNYRIVFKTTDSNGYEIKDEKQFKVLKNIDYNPNRLLKLTHVNPNSVDDNFVRVKINSFVPELFVQLNISHNEKNTEIPVYLINGEAIVSIPIQRRSSVNIDAFTVFDNDSERGNLFIDLRKNEPKLKTEVITFRNKFEPGSKETWSFKLSELNKKVEAEVLASMYDSSLDQFTTDNWNDFYVRNYSNGGIYRYYDYQFNTYIDLFQRMNLPQFKINTEKAEMIWFGFDFASVHTPINRKYAENVLKTKLPKNVRTVSGIVSDASGLPLPGANVKISGTIRETQTDFDGFYEIEALPNEKIIFEFIGMKSQEILATNSYLNVSLEEDSMALDAVVVEGYRSTTKKASMAAVTTVASQTYEGRPNADFLQALLGQIPGLQITSGSGQPGSNTQIILRGVGSANKEAQPLIVIDGVPLNEDALRKLNPEDILEFQILKDAKATAIYGNRGANGVVVITTKSTRETLAKVQTRKNFNETAFFFPQMNTDKDGKIEFTFTSPEALTSWKFRMFSHTKKLASGYLELSAITQKELMVTPNFPRFLRENDTIYVSAKIANLSAEAKSGMAMLQLFDATTMQSVDTKTLNIENVKNFEMLSNGNAVVSWKIFVPEGLQGLQYKVVAKAGDFSDGEENILPVLSNKILVTESLPIFVLPESEKSITLKNLKENNSSTLKNHQLTFEYTSNATWLAIQSLPYLMEYEHECAEQTFAKYFANALAHEILESNPKIKSVMETWLNNNTKPSKLLQNEELKSILMAETPWLLDVLDDETQKKQIAHLFNSTRINQQKEELLSKLKKMQNASGGFPWFEGGSDNVQITNHIVSGLLHLQKFTGDKNSDFNNIIQNGIGFLDQSFLAKNRTKEKIKFVANYDAVNYLYTRSFFTTRMPLSKENNDLVELAIAELQKNWLELSLNEKAMTSLALYRFGDEKTPKKILENLRQTASNNKDFGMYWIENKPGWRWNTAPIETQSLIIEAFAEIENDLESVEALKVWLLKNKQNKNWGTTKATTLAVLSLVTQGKNWVDATVSPRIKFGNDEKLTEKLSEAKVEANTGYFKINYKADEIDQNLATVTIENTSSVPGFGGIYWQYFENLDKIQSNESPLVIDKELFLKKVVENETKLIKISAETPLKTGDLVTVRLLISASENVDFVHLKDLRASCFEPVDVLSSRKRQNNLSFYQSTKDVATHFFFDQIRKGNYVLDYELRVNNAGTFASGISTLQSMYAPEFSGHSKGSTVQVKP